MRKPVNYVLHGQWDYQLSYVLTTRDVAIAAVQALRRLDYSMYAVPTRRLECYS